MKLIVDMDPGVDDAAALILALNSRQTEVLAVCTVAGNVSIDLTTLNALKVIEQLNRTIPVHIGAAGPLVKHEYSVTSENIHGIDGLGNSNLQTPKLNPSEVGALDAVSELLRTHKRKEICVLATGPLTNIALLKSKAPDLFSRIDKLSIMGGIYNPNFKGNVTEFAEFNFYCDPEAAAAVMDSSASSTPDIRVSGLDITSDISCAVNNGLLESICKTQSKPANLACAILKDPVRVHRNFNLHDIFALFALIHPDAFEFKKYGNVLVDTSLEFRGKCITLDKGSHSITALAQVKPRRFVKYLLDDLS
jgi:inosine-uridine nucleoside N-ribohydrolase